jgi:hypothetical protein
MNWTLRIARTYCRRGDNVEAVWEIAARGMSQ